jgi:Fe-S-cluster containining protein
MKKEQLTRDEWADKLEISRKFNAGRRDLEHVEVSHSICDDCGACCCKARFGYDNVRITPRDLEDERLREALLDNCDRLVDYGFGGVGLSFGENSCAFLDTEGRCGIYDYRPIACRNVVCFKEDLTHPKAPVKNRWDKWYNHLEARGLAHHESGHPACVCRSTGITITCTTWCPVQSGITSVKPPEGRSLRTSRKR